MTEGAQGKCGKQASKCQYRHVCIRCGKEGHAEKECLSKKAWVVLCDGQETEVCQKISVENQWRRVRANSWVFTHHKTINMSKSSGREQLSEASNDNGLTGSIQNCLQNWHWHLWKIAHSPSKSHFCWLCPSLTAWGVLAICWHDKGRLSKVMRWIMVPAKDHKRMRLPWGASLDWNCHWALLGIIWNGTIARNV